MQTDFDPIEAERQQLDLLTDRPVEFVVPKKSVLRFIGKPDRRFTIHPPYAGTLNHLCREFIDTDFDKDTFDSEDIETRFNERKRLVGHNTERFARIVAISVLRDGWKIRLLGGLLARYFLWRITARKSMELTRYILATAGIADFCDSIRSISIQKRTTTPALIETPEASRAPSAPTVPFAPTSAGPTAT